MHSISRILFLMFIIYLVGCTDERLNPALTKCIVSDLNTSIGECNDDGTYEVIIDFNVNSNSDTFELFVRNDQLIDTYNINDLPLNIQNFEPSGFTNDFVKICIIQENDDTENNDACCSQIEFARPDCP